MSRKILKTVYNALLASLTLFVTLQFTACKDDTVSKQEKKYTLAGTCWKLVAFIDVENNESKYVDEPLSKYLELMKEHYGYSQEWFDSVYNRVLLIQFSECLECYWCGDFGEITGERYGLQGRTFSNTITGCYSVDNNANTLNTGTHITFVYDILAEARDFGDILKGIKSFSLQISTDTLQLFYADNKKSLLFKKTENMWEWYDE